MPSISKNIQHIQHIITQKQVANTDLPDITLVAASKTQSPSSIEQALEAGITHFGENYVQEAKEKIDALAHLPIQWHFIGGIQSNKTQTIANIFHWVHSIDREKIAQRLNDQRADHLPALQCCIQVNISAESRKRGVSINNVLPLAQHIAQMPHLQLRGLMALPIATSNPDLQKRNFVKMAELFSRLQVQFPQIDTLSMGTSADMESAIDAGANLIRIGTGIFGPRKQKKT
jgi:hypothetical protein